MSTATHQEQRKEKVIDLKDRLGLRKQEIPKLLPLSLREIEELISVRDFPKGFPIREKGYLKYDVAELRAWWEIKKQSGRGASEH